MFIKRMVFVVLLAIASSAFSQDESVTSMSFIPQNPPASSSFVAHISGVWPNGCIPGIEDILISGKQITLVARSQGEFCTQALTPYQLDFEIEADTQNSFPEQGHYSVTYDVNQDHQSTSTFSFELLQIGESSIATPESGWWWAEPGGEFDTSGPGSGFTIEAQNDIVVLTANTYSEHGDSQWVLSASRMIKGNFQGSLLDLSGGQSLFGSYKAPTEAENVGKVMMTFSSPGRGTLWFIAADMEGVTGAIKVQPVSIVREIFSYDAGADILLGNWTFVLPESELLSKRVYDLDLAQAEQDEQGNVLYRNSEDTVVMSCKLDLQLPQSPPESCQITELDGTDFGFYKQIGLNSMKGNDGALAIRH